MEFPSGFIQQHSNSEGPQTEPEKTISGVYYEFYDGTPAEMMCACYHFIDMEIKKKDALVRMQAGSVKAQGHKRSRSLRVRHEPFEECLGYAAIHGP
jgi:hypothetical protein